MPDLPDPSDPVERGRYEALLIVAEQYERDRLAALTFAEAVGEVERYCVDSRRPVHMIPGDRCISHGDAPTPCATDVRPAQCTHPKLSPNHPYPHCSECGKDVTEGSDG